MTLTQKLLDSKQAASKWANLFLRALPECEDVEESVLVANLAYESLPVNALLSIEDHKEPIDAKFAWDIENRKAQGVLNRAIEAAKKMSRSARIDLEKSLQTSDPEEISKALLAFIGKYRIQLADLLTTTQLAALLEGAMEVAKSIPNVPMHSHATPPATLEPAKAVALLDKLHLMPTTEREARIYELPPDQQQFIRQGLIAKQQGSPPPPESFVPASPVGGQPEKIHYPIIDEAARSLAAKNIMTRPQFDALDDASRQKAFTVAYVESLDTIGKIREVMAETVKDGVDLQTFRERVLDAVDEGTFMSDAHLEVVFRTNVQTAFSDGQMAVLQHPFIQSGFPYAAIEPIHDDRARHHHLALATMGIQGTNIYRIDDPVFILFRSPWDYNCVLPGNLVSGQIIGALKGFYSGDALEITTANGAKTTLTINHPVLTEDGFIAAGKLNEGQNLLCHLGERERFGCFSDVEDSPIAIEKVFDSLSSTLHSESLEAFDFDGDEQFMMGKVDMVSIDLASRESMASKSERENQVSFISSNDGRVSSTCLLDSLGIGHSRPFISFGSGLISNSDSTLFQYSSDGTSRYAHGVSNDVFGFSRSIESDDFIGVDSKTVPNCRRIGLASELDTVFSKPSPNGIAFNANIVAELLERFPSKVSFSKIINIRRFHYSGPVYDLETVPGYFTTTLGGSASIIIRNCRCSWNPMTIRMAASKGIEEAMQWLETGVEPSPKAFVPMPDFRPPPGFRRSLSAVPLSINHFGVMLATKSKEAGHWITIGGSKGEDGKRHGGSPVYIENGRITKGNPKLTGKKLDSLGKPAEKSEAESKLGDLKSQSKLSGTGTVKGVQGRLFSLGFSMGLSAMFAQVHSPVGGVTLNGEFYPGGQWIPEEALAKASKEEKAPINDPATHMVKKWKPDYEGADPNAAEKIVAFTPGDKNPVIQGNDREFTAKYHAYMKRHLDRARDEIDETLSDEEASDDDKTEKAEEIRERIEGYVQHFGEAIADHLKAHYGSDLAYADEQEFNDRIWQATADVDAAVSAQDVDELYSVIDTLQSEMDDAAKWFTDSVTDERSTKDDEIEQQEQEERDVIESDHFEDIADEVESELSEDAEQDDIDHVWTDAVRSHNLQLAESESRWRISVNDRGALEVVDAEDLEDEFKPEKPPQGRLFSTDATGHEHKGKGEGGGQFTSSGHEGENDSPKSTVGKIAKKATNVYHKIHDAGSAAFKKLPSPVQKVVSKSLAVAFAGWTVSQKIAERISIEKGATPEQAAQLRSTLAAWDMVAFKPMSIATAPLGGAIAAATWVVPPVTGVYLLHSAARHPVATYRAAKGLIKEAVAATGKVIEEHTARLAIEDKSGHLHADDSGQFVSANKAVQSYGHVNNRPENVPEFHVPHRKYVEYTVQEYFDELEEERAKEYEQEKRDQRLTFAPGDLFSNHTQFWHEQGAGPMVSVEDDGTVVAHGERGHAKIPEYLDDDEVRFRIRSAMGFKPKSEELKKYGKPKDWKARDAKHKAENQ